jgi:carbonic anhydrase
VSRDSKTPLKPETATVPSPIHYGHNQLTVSSVEQSVRTTLRFLGLRRWGGKKESLYGCIYDLETGELKQMVSGHDEEGIELEE